MAKFFVGQRVRYARPQTPTGMKHAGRLGRIVQLIPERLSWGKLPIDCRLDWCPPNTFVHTGQLEPILDPGAEPSEFTTLQSLLDSLECESPAIRS